jgi:hypothetical protein
MRAGAASLGRPRPPDSWLWRWGEHRCTAAAQCVSDVERDDDAGSSGWANHVERDDAASSPGGAIPAAVHCSS